MKENIFIGVAWPYVNGELHVGHVAGYLLPADITARFYRLLGHKVLMVSGSDCFGTPITVEADNKGVKPEDVVKQYHERDVELFKNLWLSYDLYTKTDTANHRGITQKFLLAFWKEGLLKVASQKQYYSESLRRFLPDRYVEGVCPYCGMVDARSDQCDNCGKLLDQNLKDPVSKVDRRPVVLKDTEHLFIRWDKLQPRIAKYVKDADSGWREWVRNETNNWLAEGLAPRAVTRDLDWGVDIPREIAKELPGSEHKKIYVWFDAVIGYYSASLEWSEKTGQDWKEFWYSKAAKHYYFMGKDNLIFHTLFWPGQLTVYDAGLHLPDFPVISQYLNFGGKKFSKSRNVIVDSAEFIKKFGTDALRFYLTTILPENADSSFTWSDFYEKNNNLLVGHIGNYIHRVLSLYKSTKIEIGLSEEVIKQAHSALTASIGYLKKSQFKNYYEEIEQLAKFANALVNEREPWTTAKKDPRRFARDGGDLVALTYVIAALLEPITPEAASRYFHWVGLSSNEFWQHGRDTGEFLTSILQKIVIKAPTPLFRKYIPESED